jgi:hypothetical protein
MEAATAWMAFIAPRRARRRWNCIAMLADIDREMAMFVIVVEPEPTGLKYDFVTALFGHSTKWFEGHAR